MLKIYTDIKLLNNENRSQVFPLLFDLHFSKNEFLTQFYSVEKNIEDSHIVILPLEYSYMLKNHQEVFKELISKGKNLDKPIWVYSGGDFGLSLKDEQIYNFRLGGFKSKLNSNTFILPSFISDPYNLNLNRDFKVLNKEDRPKIGFVGHAQLGGLKLLKEFLSFLSINLKRVFKIIYIDYQSFYPSAVKRAIYLKALQACEGLESNFIYRKRYRAGIKIEEDKANTTRDFYNNIYENPYTFCIRGNGNFSVRFYETLAVGRIPVLLNTDCLLPLNYKINWENHCIILDETEYKSLGQTIISFHNKLSDKDFTKLQTENRKLWEDFLTRHSFFKVIHDLFTDKLN